jgi:hypothetical protein
LHLKAGAFLFDTWAAQEAKDLAWIERLPACPCYQHKIEYSPAFEAPSYSATDGFVQKYHPGAFMCYRSKKIEKKHAQQCCYDEKGALFTFGPAAGTPDRAATGTLGNILSWPDLASHGLADASPVGFAVAKIRIILGDNWDEPWINSIVNETYIKDAWIVYNAFRDDKRVASCPQNPRDPIVVHNLLVKGKPTTVAFHNAKRFLTPEEVK